MPSLALSISLSFTRTGYTFIYDAFARVNGKEMQKYYMRNKQKKKSFLTSSRSLSLSQLSGFLTLSNSRTYSPTQ